MKFLKYLGIVFILFFSLLSVNAISTNNVEAYYNFSSVLNDDTGNGHTLTGTGTTFGTGIIGNALVFDASADRASTTTFAGISSINTWIYLDSNTSSRYITADRGTAGFYFFLENSGSPGDFRLRVLDDEGGTSKHCYGNYQTGWDINTWYMVSFVINGSNSKFYKDNVEIPTTDTGCAITDVTSLTTGNGNRGLTIGNYGDSAISLDFAGRIDEIGFWTNYKLSNTNLTDLYNSGLGLQYPFFVSAIPQIQLNISNNDFFNATPINVSMNTTTNVNMSIFINTVLDQTFNDTNFTTALISLNEGNNNLSFKSEDSNGVNWNNITVTLDTINPNVSVNNFTEWNNGYNVTSLNTTLNITCIDPNLNHCEIHWNDTTITNLLTTQYKLFTSNGNSSFDLHAIDNANNTDIVEGNIYINPYVNLYFNNVVLSSLISDYTIFEGTTPYSTINTLLQIKTYTLGLGLHNFNFIKTGFVNTTFNITLNTTNEINLTTNVSPVTLQIKVYDVNTLTQLTFNVTILNSTNITSFTNEFNFSKQYSNIPNGVIELQISSVGYSDISYYTTLNPTTSISFSAYLFLANSSSLFTFNVEDSASGDPLENVLIEIQQIINNSYTTLSQKQTAGNGVAYFYLDSSLSYNVIFTKNNFVSATATTIPTITSYTVKMQEQSTLFTYIDNIGYSFTPASTSLNDNTTYLFTSFISGQSFSIIDIDIRFNNGTIIFSSSSTNPSGTTFSFPYTIPLNTNQTLLIVNLSYIVDGVRTDIFKNYNIISLINTSFLQTLKNFGNETDEESNITKWFIFMMLLVVTIVSGAISGIKEVNLMIIPLLAFFSYVDWIDWTFAAVGIFVSIVMFIGGRR